MSTDLYFTRILSFFHSSFLSANLWAGRTELNDNWPHARNLETHVRNLGHHLSLQIGGPKATFLARRRNLTASLTAYIFGMKHDIDNRSSALTTTRRFLHRLKTTWTLVHKRLQTRPSFYPPYVNSASYVISRLRRRRSANITQPDFAKRRTFKSR